VYRVAQELLLLLSPLPNYGSTHCFVRVKLELFLFTSYWLYVPTSCVLRGSSIHGENYVAAKYP